MRITDVYVQTDTTTKVGLRLVVTAFNGRSNYPTRYVYRAAMVATAMRWYTVNAYHARNVNALHNIDIPRAIRFAVGRALRAACVKALHQAAGDATTLRGAL